MPAWPPSRDARCRQGGAEGQPPMLLTWMAFRGKFPRAEPLHFLDGDFGPASRNPLPDAGRYGVCSDAASQMIGRGLPITLPRSDGICTWFRDRICRSIDASWNAVFEFLDTADVRAMSTWKAPPPTTAAPNTNHSSQCVRGA